MLQIFNGSFAFAALRHRFESLFAMVCLEGFIEVFLHKTLISVNAESLGFLGQEIRCIHQFARSFAQLDLLLRILRQLHEARGQMKRGKQYERGKDHRPDDQPYMNRAQRYTVFVIMLGTHRVCPLLLETRK